MSDGAPAGQAPPAAEPPAPPAASHGDGLARATAVITVARSVQMFSFLVVGMYLTRRLGPEYSGTYWQVPFLAQAIPMALSVPLGKAVTYFVPRSASPDAFLRRTALVLAAAGVFTGLAIGVLPGTLRLFDPADPYLVELRPVVGAIVGFAFAQSISEYALLARGRRMGVARLLVFLAAWNLLAIGGAAMFAPEAIRLEAVLLALLTCHVVPAVVTFWWLLKPTGAPAGAAGPARGEVLHYTLPLVLAVGVNYAAGQIDKFLVPHLFPMDRFPEAKDHYFRAAMEVPVLGAVALTMFGLVAPQLAGLHGRGDTEGLLALWRKACRSVAVVTIPATGLLCAVAYEAFTLVYGDRYGPAVPIFRWYLLKLVLATFLPQVLLESVGSTRRSLVFSVVALATAIGLTAALVPLFGLPGAAAAAVLASLASNWIFGGWLARHRLGVGWSSVLDWNHLLRITAASGIAALVALVAIPRGLAGDPTHLVHAVLGDVSQETLVGVARAVRHLTDGLLHGAAFAAVFLLLARVLRSVSPEDLEMLRGLVRRRRSAR